MKQSNFRLANRSLEHLDYDWWTDHYIPIANPINRGEAPVVYNEDDSETSYGYCYKQDFQHVQSHLNQHPNTCWTMMDSECIDAIVLVPGLRYVNRLGYLLTKTPYDTEPYAKGSVLYADYRESEHV